MRQPVRRWELWGLALLSLSGIALVLLALPATLVVGVLAQVDGDVESFASLLALALGSLSLPLILGMAGWFSLRRLQGRTPRVPLTLRAPVWAYLLLIGAWGGSLLLGRIFSQGGAWQALTGILHLPAVFMPVLFALLWTVDGLELGTPLRIWGVLAVDAMFAPLLSTLFELLLLIMLAAVTVAWLADVPNLAQQFSFWLRPPLQEAVLLRAVRQLLQDHPQINYLWLGYFSILIPLTEELLKPLALWMLGDRLRSARQGFALGAVSGAVFAWYENLMTGASIMGAEWAGNLLLRAMTPAVHILASGLVGWGIALLWRERRWGKFLLLFLSALALHGLWNGLAVLEVLQELNGWLPWSGEQISLALGASFVVLYLLAMIALRWLNVRWLGAQPEQGETALP